MSTRVERIDGKLAYRGKVLPPGPWHDEPDHVEFEHVGFPCILHRNMAWCGYVAVPPGHPWHGKGYDWENGIEAEVHGGITYAEKCQGAICHVAKPGEPDDVWWVGFDCNHHLDLSLYDLIELNGRDSRIDSPAHGWVARYRDIGYVRWQTKKLAEQAKAVSK